MLIKNKMKVGHYNMSLNKEQRRITAIELREHFHNSTLNIEDIANKMSISVEEVEKVLNMNALAVSLVISYKDLYIAFGMFVTL